MPRAWLQVEMKRFGSRGEHHIHDLPAPSSIFFHFQCQPALLPEMKDKEIWLRSSSTKRVPTCSNSLPLRYTMRLPRPCSDLSKKPRDSLRARHARAIREPASLMR